MKVRVLSDHQNQMIAALAIIGLATIGYAAVVPELLIPDDTNTVPNFVPQCPDKDGPLVTLIGNPNNCTTYFTCNMGNPVEMSCPAELHFNDKKKVCDWPTFACCDPAYDPHNRCGEESEEKTSTDPYVYER